MAYGTTKFDITVTDGTTTWTIGSAVNEQNCHDVYGLNPTDDDTTATLGYSVDNASKNIVKMYGSDGIETYILTPDGTVVTDIDGAKLCSKIKSISQYLPYYKSIVSFTFTYRSSSVAYADGYDANGVERIHSMTTPNTLKNTYGVTFSSSVQADDSVSIPTSYAEGVSRLIFRGPA